MGDLSSWRNAAVGCDTKGLFGWVVPMKKLLWETLLWDVSC
jgi:hypothetical protein